MPLQRLTAPGRQALVLTPWLHRRQILSARVGRQSALSETLGLGLGNGGPAQGLSTATSGRPLGYWPASSGQRLDPGSTSAGHAFGLAARRSVPAAFLAPFASSASGPSPTLLPRPAGAAVPPTRRFLTPIRHPDQHSQADGAPVTLASRAQTTPTARTQTVPTAQPAATAPSA